MFDEDPNEYLFENLQKMHEAENMQYLKEDLLLEMAKLLPDQADKNITGDLDVYIYFSVCQDAHGPRIKFDGGTKETSNTHKAPSYTFSVDGPGNVLLQNWMNKKNTPNAFNKNILNNVSNFINTTLPILLLTWFEKLDEGYALWYLQGILKFEDMLKRIILNDEILENEILKVKDLKELHDFCKRSNLYTF